MILISFKIFGIFNQTSTDFFLTQLMKKNMYDNNFKEMRIMLLGS
jgi:hypothetical protein